MIQNRLFICLYYYCCIFEESINDNFIQQVVHHHTMHTCAYVSASAFAIDIQNNNRKIVGVEEHTPGGTVFVFM